MQQMLFFVVATLCLSLAYSVKIGKFEPRCPSGSFWNTVTARCQACTPRPCPSPLVEVSACRHDADAICGEPDAHADAADGVAIVDKPRPTKSCAGDSFFNRETELCQECIRFCSPPLVMTEPCRGISDAVCAKPPKSGGRTSSRRRKDKHERKRRRKTRKRPKPSHQTTSNVMATPDQLCSNEGKQFYDSAQGHCVQCRSCDGALEEISPCTSTSDRACRLKHRPGSPKDPLTGSSAAAGLQSNELPKDGRIHSVISNRSHNNEYPDSRAVTGSGLRPDKTDKLRGNSADNQDRTSSDSIHSNIAE